MPKSATHVPALSVTHVPAPFRVGSVAAWQSETLSGPPPHPASPPGRIIKVRIPPITEPNMSPRMLLAVSLFTGLLAVGQTADGQEPKKEEQKAVKLRWFGQSFFQLEDSTGQKIVFDPHAIPTFGTPRVKADFVLISHLHDDHNQPEVLDPPPTEGDIYRGVVALKGVKQEWKQWNEKRGPIKFRTLSTYHDAVMGMQRGRN